MMRYFKKPKRNLNLFRKSDSFTYRINPKKFSNTNSLYKFKHGRYIFDYSENYTAAIHCSLDKRQLDKNFNNVPFLLSTNKNNIVEHAARKVDLFFYTLVAYFNKKLEINENKTLIQHGKGHGLPNGASITQACHSSLTPSLIDNNDSPNHPVSILSNTHFMDSLNATIELPSFVNEFDSELENVYLCRKKSIDILNEVSSGQTNPIKGLHQFLLMMQATFEQILKDQRFYKPIFSNLPLSNNNSAHLKNELLALFKKGTFTNKLLSNNRVNGNYIFMLLRFTPQEIKIYQSNPNLRDVLLIKKMSSIQAEILQTPNARIANYGR